MCGILGLFNDPRFSANFSKGWKALAHRGLDAAGCSDGSRVQYVPAVPPRLAKTIARSGVAHCLHAIVARVPQPMVGAGTLVANCEIYNWKTLAHTHRLNAQNDADALFGLLERTNEPPDAEQLAAQLDGDYAFAYWKKNTLFLMRDPLGVKPLWYAIEKKRVAFASEAKALRVMGFESIHELHPRHALRIDLKNAKITDRFIPFLGRALTTRVDDVHPLSRLETLFLHAVQKRVPDQKLALLFSGGIDSVLLAQALKKLGHSPTLFIGYIKKNSGDRPADVPVARTAARMLGFELVENALPESGLEGVVRSIVRQTETADPTKIAVGLPLHLALAKAGECGYRVAFSGLGADELFGGYARQVRGTHLSDECLSYVRQAFERDLYRDDVLGFSNRVELRVPYYDHALVRFALGLDEKLKVDSETRKVALRRLARKWGIHADLANRPKKAAQYGSHADAALTKLVKQSGAIHPPSKRARSIVRPNAKNLLLTKGAFFGKMLGRPNARLGVLCSGGKDSHLALHIMQKRNYEIACLLTVKSANPDSFMFHTPQIDLVKKQARTLGLPLLQVRTRGQKEAELADLEKLLVQAKQKFDLDGIVSGALYSNYQRNRIEDLCERVGLKAYHPLWHKDSLDELREIVLAGFDVRFVKVAAGGLDETWIGRKLDEKTISELAALEKKWGLNPAGEGGEYETLVVNGPGFKKKILFPKA